MRRMVKEELLTFDGRPLFPERRAYTRRRTRCPTEEALLYDEVTEYVREEMNRAERLEGRGRGPPRQRRRLRAHRPAAPARLVARGDLPVAAPPPRAARDAPERGAPRPPRPRGDDRPDRRASRRRPRTSTTCPRASSRSSRRRSSTRRRRRRRSPSSRPRSRPSRALEQLAEQVRALGHRREVDASWPSSCRTTTPRCSTSPASGGS